MGWQEEMELLKRKRGIAKGKFTRKVTLLDEGVREDGECRDALDLVSVGVLVGPPCYRQSCEDALDWMIVGVTCQVCYGNSKSVSVGH
ncbi:uncharacterized protein LOC135102172 isoform X2 [Scylla paramamosain]|uniref:uncharacterized protein LOC135102172 isoform X2 n=1 Tax=Scylla paramamosain TaxID=85552 RepID=UPI003083E0EB